MLDDNPACDDFLTCDSVATTTDSEGSPFYRHFRHVLLALALLCRSQAQPQQASLEGRVLDPTGAPIAGAQVRAVPDGGASVRPVFSGQKGEFSLLLEPGMYILEASKDGFAEASQRVDLRPGSSEPHDIMLQVAPVSAT